MADITINGVGVGSQLMSIINCEAIMPGTATGYETCKLLWEFLPLSSKLIERPIILAMSKPRIISMDIHPKEMLIKAFNREWEAIGANDLIRDTAFMTRAYGAAAIVYGAKGIPTDQPIDPWKLQDLDLYFNKLDPLNLAGSLVGNQNPNAPDFMKPMVTITASGQPYHSSRSCVQYANTPIYLSYQPSGYGFTGRSVFQRSLYPIKSYIQSMVTDQMVTLKAGLLISKQKQSGAIVNKLMQIGAGIKRSFLAGGVTGNVLSIDIDEDIEAIDLSNTDTAMTTARNNIIANIAAGADCPSVLLKDESYTAGFAEGDNDALALATYLTGVRNDLAPMFSYFDKIVMHRAWSREFFEAVKNEYPEQYGKKSYEEAFYEWQEAFDASWTPMVESKPEEKVKTEDVKLKAMTEMLRTMLPVINPENRAVLLQWAADNINEMPELFKSSLNMDYDQIADYEPPEPLTEQKLPNGT